MLIALATSVRTEQPAGEILGVLQGTIDLVMFNRWLVDIENMDGECPVRFSLLLNRDQLIRHPCPLGAGLPEDGYGSEPSVARLLRSGAASHFRDPLGSGVDYFAATSRFVKSDQWRALVLHDRARALPALGLTFFPVVLLAGVTAWVGYLLFREH
jgi:hypothetical protein